MNLYTRVKSQGFKNSFWSLVNSVAYPFIFLLSTPFFIDNLGAEQFGIWVFINIILQLVSFVNFGVGDSIVKFVSKYAAESNITAVNETISSIFLTSIISLGVLVVGMPLAAIPIDNEWVSLPKEFSAIAIKSLRIALVLFVLKFLEIALLAILQAYSLYNISSRFLLFSSAFTLAVNITCVYIGFDLFAIFVGSTCVQLVALLLEVYIIKNKFPFINLTPVPNFKRPKLISNFSLWFWLLSVLAIVITQTDRLLVAYFSGMEVLSYCSVGAMLAIQIHTILVAVSAWVFPEVSKKITRNEALREFYADSNFILLTFSLILIYLLLLLEKPLMTLWLGTDIYLLASDYIKLFLYYILFLTLNIIPYYFLNGAGFVKKIQF